MSSHVKDVVHFGLASLDDLTDLFLLLSVQVELTRPRGALVFTVTYRYEMNTDPAPRSTAKT